MGRKEEKKGLTKEPKGQITVALVKALLSALKKRTIKGDVGRWKCNYVLEKRMGDIDECENVDERLAFLRTEPYGRLEGEDNCLLNSGINEIWDLVSGVVSGTGHIYDNTKAQIGVGDSNTAANATQTDLQAAVNKTYKGMEGGFPTSASQKITLKSSFGSSDANYEWKEWVVKQSTSAKCLNRKVDAMGTKASGSTWTLEVTITLS